jgi:putative flippase GtrA
MLRIPASLLGYFITAGVAAIVDVGGFVLLNHLGVPLLAAATASFLVAVLVNYSLSSRFVFKVRPSGAGLLKFAAGALIGLAVNVGVTFVAATSLGLMPALAKIAGVGVAFLVNYAVNAKLVFRA